MCGRTTDGRRTSPVRILQRIEVGCAPPLSVSVSQKCLRRRAKRRRSVGPPPLGLAAALEIDSGRGGVRVLLVLRSARRRVDVRPQRHRAWHRLRGRGPERSHGGGVLVGLQREAKHCAPNLDREGILRHQGSRLLHRHERSELRVVVLQREGALMQPDGSMASRDGHVRDAHVALVPTAQFQQLVLREGEHVQAAGGVLVRVAHHVL
mmetsp:Transcript_83716/g.215565  ORF Transcript_83716/g.215565 Transcript_83716/m.215565 type:complete len:208 (-) Transcript_83716:877-1500(-)